MVSLLYFKKSIQYHTQALKDEKWRRTMSIECNVFARNDTFDLFDRFLAKNIEGSKWIFRIKHLPNGSVNRYKVRLVAKGFCQHSSVDFHDTLSPVIKHVKIVLSLEL